MQTVCCSCRSSRRANTPSVFTPNNEYSGDSVKLVIETKEVQGLIAYVQKLGMNRGKWRDLFEPQQMEAVGITIPRSQEWIDYGKEVYERRCVGLPPWGAWRRQWAGRDLPVHVQRPRNFTQGVFKFRLTEDPVPSDGDMLRTITRGVRGTAMPPWYDLPLNDRLAVIQYIKYVLAVDRTDPKNPALIFVNSPPGQPLYRPAPLPTPAMIAHGKEVWTQAKCWECHGKTEKATARRHPG